MPARPEIVCICGSARFADALVTANRELTLAGAIVLAPAALDASTLTSDQRAALGELHLRKIDLADRVVVVNPGGYVGEAAMREIAYARAAGKPVSFTDAEAREVSDRRSAVGRPHRRAGRRRTVRLHRWSRGSLAW